jgi:hypothetical protein
MEVAQQVGSKRRRKTGRPAGVGHWSEIATPTHICKVLIALGLGMMPIPNVWSPYLAVFTDTINLKTPTGCNWNINITNVSGRACLDRGWPSFAIANDLNIGFLLIFKKLSPMIYKVVILDYNGVEGVKRCHDHPKAMERIIFHD